MFDLSDSALLQNLFLLTCPINADEVKNDPQQDANQS
jgi:hypothetical protein